MQGIIVAVYARAQNTPPSFEPVPESSVSVSVVAMYYYQGKSVLHATFESIYRISICSACSFPFPRGVCNFEFASARLFTDYQTSSLLPLSLH